MEPVLGTPVREVSNVSQVTDTTEAMTKRTKHVNVTELHAMCFLVTDSVPTHHLVKQIPLDRQITRTHFLQKEKVERKVKAKATAYFFSFFFNNLTFRLPSGP